MRIIAGKHRGRRIESPKGKDIRPTTDRCREAVFNLLMHMKPNPVIDQRVLDLCCGTGALGLEALSRGAAHATFMDQSSAAMKLARHNCETMNELDNASFSQTDSSQPTHAPEPVALVLMDAPYHSGLIGPAFQNLKARGWLKEGTVLAFEQDHKEEFPELEGCEIVKQRDYGKTRVTIVEYNG